MGRKSGGTCSRQLLRLACSDFQLTRIGDRQNKHIAEVEGEADYEGGRRDHREGV